MSPAYGVELTATAEKTFSRLYQEAQECIDAGDGSNSKVTLFRMVEEIVTKIIPHDPFSTSRALSGKLSKFFRIKKGRIRVCYTGSSEQRKIIILYISETPRKEGDVNDPYAIFTKLVMSGRFDKEIANLGIKPPDRTGLPAPIYQ
jgi:mRNA-degrading endonuclease RelE of RelBE toxin-antitoxin system